MATKKEPKESTAAPGAAEQPGGSIKVCVLVDSAWGKAGSVIELSAIEAQTGVASGELDTAAAAVAHASAQASNTSRG